MRALAITACTFVVGCAYEPSSFSFLPHRTTSTRATIGCLDLAISRRAPAPDGHLVLAYAFGNRCDQPAVVDLASLPVVGHSRDGRGHALAPFDPGQQLQLAVLDGRDQGTEMIAYPSTAALVDVCVDAAAIAHHAPSRWLCVMTDAP